MSRMRPSPAMVVALVALIASVTSGAYAAVRITTADIADRAVTNPKLADNSVWHRNIGRGSARNFNLSDNSVWHRNIDTRSVRQNNIANGAVGSDQIEPHAVGAAQLDVNQPWRNIGTEGQPGFPVPGFQSGWRNAGLGPSPTPAGFTVDADRVVHLRGQVAGGTVSPDASSSTVVTLPVGDRPVGGQRYFPVLTTNGSNVITPGWVAINPSGQVFVGAGNNAFVALDNISFSAVDLTFQPDAHG